MLWYGLFYYFICFFSLIFLFSFYSLQISKFSIYGSFLFLNVYKIIFNFVLFFLLINIFNIYNYINFTSPFFFKFFNFDNYYLVDYSTLSTVSCVYQNFHSPLNIYFFPFMYIFYFITILSLFFCLSYNKNELYAFTIYCATILYAGYLLFITDSVITFFFAYELLLIPSFFILYKYAKTKRCIEAAYLMFFWTQFGAFFLIFSFLYIFFITNSSSFQTITETNFNQFEVNFLFVCWFISFGVKLPIWPFYGWLPKAHVEASTNFSIFLSGVLVKFAFFGLFKCLLSVQLEPTFIYIYPLLFIGLTDSVFKLFFQIDLKKLVAYSTVVEMHWLTICVVSGYSCLFLSAFCMLISHALLSSNAFLLVDAINRRFKTRLITELSGLNFLTPKLFLFSLINCLIFLGFPGSIFFIAEFLFFSFFLDLFPLLTLLLIVLLYLCAPTFFFRSWFNLMFGSPTFYNKSIPADLSSKEILTFSILTLFIFWLGFSWHVFLF